jgi:hypothetical protein
LGAWEGCPSMQQHPCSITTSAITQQPLPSAPRRRTSLLSIGNALVSRVCGRSANPRPMGRMLRGGTSRGPTPRPKSTQQRAWAGNLRRGPGTRVMARVFRVSGVDRKHQRALCSNTKWWASEVCLKCTNFQALPQPSGGAPRAETRAAAAPYHGQLKSGRRGTCTQYRSCGQLLHLKNTEFAPHRIYPTSS